MAEAHGSGSMGQGPWTLGPMGQGPWTMGAMGQGPWTMGPWARVHGPKTGKRLSDVVVHVEALIVC